MMTWSGPSSRASNPARRSAVTQNRVHRHGAADELEQAARHLSRRGRDRILSAPRRWSRRAEHQTQLARPHHLVDQGAASGHERQRQEPSRLHRYGGNGEPRRQSMDTTLPRRTTPSRKALLERAIDRGVLLAPGDGCGEAYASWARICFTSVPRRACSRGWGACARRCAPEAPQARRRDGDRRRARWRRPPPASLAPRVQPVAVATASAPGVHGRRQLPERDRGLPERDREQRPPRLEVGLAARAPRRRLARRRLAEGGRHEPARRRARRRRGRARAPSAGSPRPRCRAASSSGGWRARPRGSPGTSSGNASPWLPGYTSTPSPLAQSPSSLCRLSGSSYGSTGSVSCRSFQCAASQ